MTNSSLAELNLMGQAQDQTSLIMATLLNEGYEYDQAYLIAQSRTEMQSIHKRAGAVERATIYHVIPHPRGWVVSQLDGESPCLVFASSSEAIQIGKEVASANNAVLIIHEKNGAILQ